MKSFLSSSASLALMAATASCKSLAPFKYSLLPLGQLKPKDWIKDQLQLEADGLASHLVDFYSELHESAPYWYNALVPLAYVIDDSRLEDQVNTFLDYVLAHQAEDGWLGPETDPHERGIWARMLLLQDMANHATADPAREEEIVTSMHRYVTLTHSMLQNNYTGFLPGTNDTFDPYKFGVSRAHEYSVSLQWLYDEHRRNQNQMLWDTMNLMWRAAAVANSDWRTFFTPVNFTKGESAAKAKYKIEHGVTLAEGLRYMAQMYRMTEDSALVDQTRFAIDSVYTYHMSPAGSVIADEYLAGRSPSRGSELCMTVETMFSTAYLYRLFSDKDYADKAELAAFNALPAALSADWWSHQYVTQSNQPWSKNLSGDPFYNVVTYANVFGLEPNFPCCTVNHGAAYQKFFSSAVTKAGEDALLHMFLVPFEVQTSVRDKQVSIECDTAYPFGSLLRYNINTATPFRFGTRVPLTITNASYITTGNKNHTRQSFTASADGIHWLSIIPGNTTVSLNLAFQTTILANTDQNTVSIYHGPILYSVDIPYTITETPSLNRTDRAPLAAEQLLPQVHDHTYLPTKDSWAIAVDPSKIKVHAGAGSVTVSPNPFVAPSLSLHVAAVRVEWVTTENDTVQVPAEPIAIGEPFWAKLVPFGSAKLHVAEFPTLRLELE